jgi:hypothetical protein
LQDGCYRWLLPNQVAKASSSRELERMGLEEVEHQAFRFHPQKSRKNEGEALLDFPLGVLVDRVGGIPDQPNGQL